MEKNSRILEKHSVLWDKSHLLSKFRNRYVTKKRSDIRLLLTLTEQDF